jgi:GNAT superfamily N-acetyltransferase
MKIALDFKFKNELSSDEIKRLKQLHLRNGLMFNHFKNEDDCSVVLAYHKSLIVGWGLVFFNIDEEMEFHVFVHKKYRRKQIGTQIFELASELYPMGLCVLRWSDEASAFYSNFNVIEEDPK